MSDPIAEPEYHRLTWAHRRGTSFFAFSPARSSLWLGKDHLLCVDSTGYNEKYKRFYFRDIQAILLRKTEHRAIWALAFGALGTLCAMFAFIVNDQVWPYILGTLAGLSALGLLLQLASGPTCSCQLRTAVQTEELGALNRVPRAQRILRRLRPLIAAAQGELASEEVAARLAQVPSASAPAPSGLPDSEQPAVTESPGVPPKIES